MPEAAQSPTIEQIRALPRDARERIALALAEKARRTKQRRFHDLFPDETRYAPDGSVAQTWDGIDLWGRDLYPRHLAFFAASQEFREIGFMAANRCITPWTWLDDEKGQPARLSADTWTAEGASVQAWVGGRAHTARSQDGLLLGIEQAFRVVLDSGRFFDCTRRHRVLSGAGWVELDQLVSLSSGLRCWRTPGDYQASCASDGYLGDRPLRSVGGIDLASPPRQGGAQGRGPLFFAMPDEAEPTLRRIRACPELGRLTSRDDLRRHVALFGLFSGASSAQSCLSLSEASRSEQRRAQALSLQSQSYAGPHPDQFGGGARREADQTLCLDTPCTPLPGGAECQGARLWRDAQGPGGSTQEWLRGAEGTAIFYPSEHPDLVGGRRIIAIVPLGLQPIIDAHVPSANSYLAGEVVHHNTGKSVAGAFALTADLTGLYPPWWPGRRFRKPIRAWAAGKTNETTRDIVQAALLGEVEGAGTVEKRTSGTGMIPGRLLGKPTWKQGVADLVDTIKVKHVTGGWSLLGLKSYQQGRGSFEGTAIHAAWLDEEPPEDVYGEVLTRTATTDGIVRLTFTPLGGMTGVAMQFMPGSEEA